MSQNFFSGMFQPVVLNGSGQITVAAGYKAKFYEAGTSTPKTIYTDAGLTTAYPSPSNTAELDADGKALIYLGTGGYKLVLTDPDDDPVAGYTIDNITGTGAFGTGFVNSFEDLKDVNTTLFPYTYIGGYYEPGDGGQGMFYNETSGASLDGGYIQESDFDPAKRWFRVPDEDGKVRSASFGAIGTITGRTSEMTAADTYAAGQGTTLLINKSVLVGSMTFTAPFVDFVSGQRMRGSSSTWTFNGAVVAGEFEIFDNSTGTYTAVLSSKTTSNPYWFGGSPSASGAVNATAFALWKAAGAGRFLLPAGSWPHTGAFTLSTTIPTIFDGVLLNGAGPALQYGQGAYYPGNDSEFRAALINASAVVATGAITGGSVGSLSTVTAATGISTTAGDIFTDDGSVYANGGAVGAGTTVSAGTSISAGTTITAGEGITATTGNIIASAGSIIASTSSVEAGTSLSAGTSLTTGTHILAGTYVRAKAGSGTTNFKAAGSGEKAVNSTSDVTLQANSLTGTNDYIRIICGGTTTSANPTYTVTLGGTTVFGVALDIGGGGGDNPYMIEVMVFRTGATTAWCLGKVVSAYGTAPVEITAAADLRGVSITWANNNTVSHTVTSGTKALTMFEIFPAV